LPKDEDGQISLKLSKKIRVSSDTNIYRFAWDNENMVLGLPIGKHVVFSAVCKTNEKPEGEEISRKYTPISLVTQKGYVDFLIKVYRPLLPRFPEGGIMSQYVDTL
jgi:NAD(P)H-flavin reductase